MLMAGDVILLVVSPSKFQTDGLLPGTVAWTVFCMPDMTKGQSITALSNLDLGVRLWNEYINMCFTAPLRPGITVAASPNEEKYAALVATYPTPREGMVADLRIVINEERAAKKARV